MLAAQFFLRTVVEDWLAMLNNTVNFFLWLLIWIGELLYTGLIVLPQKLALGFYQWLLLRLPPVVRVCNDGGCELTDVGKAVPVILAMLGVVWWLKHQGKKREGQ